jgi:hypothetical protein
LRSLRQQAEYSALVGLGVDPRWRWGCLRLGRAGGVCVGHGQWGGRDDDAVTAHTLCLQGLVGFLLFPPDWWETAADMPIPLTLLQGGSSAFQTGPIAP